MATKSIRKACDDIPNAIKKEDKRSGQKPDLFAFNKVSYFYSSHSTRLIELCSPERIRTFFLGTCQ